MVALVYVAVGLLAWHRRSSSRLGLLIVLAGAAILLAGLSSVDTPTTGAVGAITQTLIFGVIVHLLLGFPTGRLRERFARPITAACYAVCLLLQPPAYLFAGGGPLSIADRPDLVHAGLQVQVVRHPLLD